MPSFVLGLAWQLADGSCMEEPWQYFSQASLGAALAAARRDGVAGAFGRRFLGVSRIEDFETNSQAPWTTRAIEERLAATLIEALAPRIEAALVDIDLAAFAEPARTGPPPAAIEDTPWWKYECAFGSGTLVGVTLRRCLAVDADDARAEAELVGECIAHQTTLYPVTPAAIGAIVALLPLVAPGTAQTLSNWLEVVADGSTTATPAPAILDVARQKLRKSLSRAGVPPFLLDDLVERGLLHDAAVRGCRAAFVTHAEALEALARAGRVGKKTAALTRRLARASR